MKFSELEKLVVDLPVGGTANVYKSSNGDQFYLKRPKEVPKGLKRSYDVEKNVQIWVRESNCNEFMPNHLRILIDLDFKRKARHDLQSDLLEAFDSVFYGKDPIDIARSFRGEFPQPLRPLDYDLFLEQLFMAEQSIGYSHESKFDPKYLYLHGWIRCVLCGREEIDDIVWSATRHGPLVEYTREDNKKHRMYNANRKKMWYLTQ